MKRRILFFAAVVVGIGFTACSVDTSELEKAGDDLKKEMNEATDKLDEQMEDAKTESEATSSVMFQCPDDCENGPAYFKEGPCKKCGKEMVEI